MSSYKILASAIFVSLMFAGCGSGGSQGDDAGKSSLAVLYLSDDFNTGTFDPRWNEAFIRPEYYLGSAPAFVPFEDHGLVLHYHIPRGTNEFTPVQVGATGTETFLALTGQPSIDEFYVEWEEYFPADHDFADGSQKLLRLTGYYPDEISGTELNWVVQSNNTNLQLSLIHLDGGNSPYIDKFTNTGVGIPTGRWVKFGVWARLNTPGESDGFGRAYVDGVQLVAMEEMSFRGDDERGWNVLWIGGTHSNGADNLTVSDSDRYIDNVHWFSTKPAE